MDSFFERPILNSPYAYPDRHWELDDDGQPTNQILPKRRDSKLLTPVPKPQKRRRATGLFRDSVGCKLRLRQRLGVASM
jgi:type III restriction enzyme